MTRNDWMRGRFWLPGAVQDNRDGISYKRMAKFQVGGRLHGGIFEPTFFVSCSLGTGR